MLRAGDFRRKFSLPQKRFAVGSVMLEFLVRSFNASPVSAPTLAGHFQLRAHLAYLATGKTFGFVAWNESAPTQFHRSDFSGFKQFVKCGSGYSGKLAKGLDLISEGHSVRGCNRILNEVGHVILSVGISAGQY